MKISFTAIFNRLLAAGALFLLPVLVHSQVYPQWARYDKGATGSYDFARGLATDADGNIIVTGTSGMNYVTIKYNSAGVQQWVQVYDGPAHGVDEAAAVLVDHSGSIYVTGKSEGNGTGADFATVKYNAKGVLQWVRRYNGTGNSTDEGRDLAMDSAGNLYVTGSSYGTGQNADYLTIRYNAAGVQQWVQRYNGTGNADDFPAALYVDQNGNIYTTGMSAGASGADFVTVKYSSGGVQQWVQRFDRLAGDGATAITGVGDFIYVTGWSFNPQGTHSDFTTIKYNSGGVQQWVQFYDGPGHNTDQAAAIATDASGNLYVTGPSFGSSVDYATLKYDPSGVLQWAQRYNGPANGTDNSVDVAVDPRNHVYVTGFSVAGGTSSVFSDYLTIKYDPSGNQEWISRYNGAGNNSDQPTALTVDYFGNVLVTGGSISTGDYDYLTIKYLTPFACGQDNSKILVCHQGQPLCISSSAVKAHLAHGDQEGSCEETAAFSSVIPETAGAASLGLSAISNPATTGSRIAYILPFDARVTVTIYEPSGKQKAVLTDAVQKKGRYEVQVSTAGWSQAVYYVKISAVAQDRILTGTKKLAVIR